MNAIGIAASMELGNEANTALKSYIHPRIINNIEEGRLSPTSRKNDENALLEFLNSPPL